jgi:hypothetical protein
VLVELLALEDVEVGHRHGGRDGVAAERVAVGEAGVALQERLHHAVGCDHRAER